MRLVMCSVYDSKAEGWHQPMYFQAVGQALRSFSDAVNSENSDFGKHPEDYTMFQVGEWDEATGQLLALDAAVVVCKAITVKETAS